MTTAPPAFQHRRSPDLWPALLLGGPTFVLLLVFLIGPFFAGISYSFTNQRLISGKPTEFVGLRNYARLLKVNTLMLEPLKDAAGQPERGAAGELQYPRSREFTRNTAKYPQYEGMREWFTLPWAIIAWSC